jgi:hypothetical protein
MTLSDLVFLKQAGVFIDVDIFANVFEYENKHRDFSTCHGCGAETWQQHRLECPRSSILTMADWYVEIQRRYKHSFAEEV